VQKLISKIYIFALLLTFCEIANSNEYEFLTGSESSDKTDYQIFGVNSSGTQTLLNTYTGNDNYIFGDMEDARTNEYKGKIYFDVREYSNYNSSNGMYSGESASYLLEYDVINNTFTKRNNIPEDALLHPEGLNQIISCEGATCSFGNNSIKTEEISGQLKMWGTDNNAEIVPINITNGSKLLINGVSVQEQINTNKANINNLGSGVAGSTALTAALSALPQTSKESKLSCGFGSGAYSSRYAVGFGCASKINERVDVNTGGSYVFGGSKSYGGGTLDSGVIKAGFVFKLGELNKPTQISMEDKEKMETKIESLEERNKELLSRLERLEKIALNETKSKDLEVYRLK